MFGHLVGRAVGDGATTIGAVSLTHRGVEHPQIFIQIGHSADGRARIVEDGLLLNGNDRREPSDKIDIRLLHLLDKALGIGGHGLHKAPLALGVHRVKGQR